MGNRKLISKWLYFFIFLASAFVIPAILALIYLIIYSNSFLEELYIIPFFGSITFLLGLIPALLTTLFSLIIRNRYNFYSYKFVFMTAFIGEAISFLFFLAITLDFGWAFGVSIFGLCAAFFSSLTIVLIERRINRNMTE